MSVLTVECAFPLERVYDARIWAFRCFIHPVSDSFELTTHTMQITSVTSSKFGKVLLIGKLISRVNVEVMAFLVIVYSQTDNDTRYFLIRHRPDIHRNIEANLTGLPTGHFAVSVFLINKEGLPLLRAIGVPKYVQVENKESM